MKKIFVSICVLLITYTANAQVIAPPASVPSKSETTVGLTKIGIEYSRPSMNGREIFGALVPYGQIWRTGANMNTIVTFSEDVKIGGRLLKAGKYGLFTKPGKDAWTIYFYDQSTNWGNQVKWNESDVAAQVTSKVEHLAQPVQTFLITLGDVKNDSANLDIWWDKVKVSAKIEVPTDQAVMASIEKTMKANPTARDYMTAATYYYNTNRNIQQAKTWMDKGMALNQKPAYYNYYQQALIYRKAGDISGALKLAKKSLESAKEAGDTTYIRYGNIALKEWK